MDIAVTIVMMIPVILAVALIINVIRKNLTEREAGDPVNITGVIPAVIVLVVAVMIIGSMGAAISPYSYDEDSGELTINSDVGSGSQEWDSYGTDVKSLVLMSKVKTVADGAFDTLTALEYLEITDTVESITSSAFGVTLKDALDQTITEPEAGEYVGSGDGTLYYCDDAIFTYSNNNTAITGLASEAASAVRLVIPEEHAGSTIVAIGTAAFRGNTSIATLLHVPGSELKTVSYNAFRECTSLATIDLPDSVDTIRNNAFRGCAMESFVVPPLVETIEDYTFQGCTSLVTVDLANVEAMGQNALAGCSSMASIVIPDSVSSYGNSLFSSCSSLASATLSSTASELSSYMFNSCSSLASIVIPDNVTTIGNGCFQNCSGITSVTFGTGLTTLETSTPFPAWTFYDSDGTTQLDKTDVTALAGFTFQGTASALVKVLPDRSALTEEQTLQVQELTKAASKTLLLDEKEISPVEEKELASA